MPGATAVWRRQPTQVGNRGAAPRATAAHGPRLPRPWRRRVSQRTPAASGQRRQARPSTYASTMPACRPEPRGKGPTGMTYRAKDGMCRTGRAGLAAARHIEVKPRTCHRMGCRAWRQRRPQAAATQRAPRVRAPTPGAAPTRAKSAAEARDRGRPRPRGRRGPSATTTTDRQGWQPRASIYDKTATPPARRRKGAERTPTGPGRRQANRRRQGHRHHPESAVGDAPDLPHSRPQRRQHNTWQKGKLRRGRPRQDGCGRRGSARAMR